MTLSDVEVGDEHEDKLQVWRVGTYPSTLLPLLWMAKAKIPLKAVVLKRRDTRFLALQVVCAGKTAVRRPSPKN